MGRAVRENRTRRGVVALVSAPYEGEGRVGESLGVRYLAAELRRERHHVDVWHLDLRPSDVTAFLERASEYDIIGLTALFSSQLPETLAFADAVRSRAPKAFLVIGGQGISFSWNEVLDSCAALNCAVCYEADETLPLLVDRVINSADFNEVAGLYIRTPTGIHFTGYRDPPVALDDLPFPDRDDLSFVEGQPHMTILSSRGCSAHCTFCQSGNYGNRYHSVAKWRPRGVLNVLSEMEFLSKEYGVNTFSFVDDDFLGACAEGQTRGFSFAAELGGRQRAFRYAIETRVDEISQPLLQALYDSGLRHIFMGIESGNSADLRIFGKRTDIAMAEHALDLVRSLPISWEVGFIMFQPLSNVSGITENLNFLQRNKLGTVRQLVSALELYPGSPLASHYASRGVNTWRDGYKVAYQFADPVIARFRDVLMRVLDPMHDHETHLRKALFRAEAELDPEDRDSQSEASEARDALVRLGNLESNLALEALSTVQAAPEMGTDDIISRSGLERRRDAAIADFDGTNALRVDTPVGRRWAFHS